MPTQLPPPAPGAIIRIPLTQLADYLDQHQLTIPGVLALPDRRLVVALAPRTPAPSSVSVRARPCSSSPSEHQP